jgi:hypothetical protein
VRKNIEILLEEDKKPKEGLFYGFCKIREANTSSFSLSLLPNMFLETKG